MDAKTIDTRGRKGGMHLFRARDVVQLLPGCGPVMAVGEVAEFVAYSEKVGAWYRVVRHIVGGQIRYSVRAA